ncbi:alpha/beta-hydrolase [Mycena leptocephala]|nr:alpha/beta-hydrolase [Mycena leptocephala]
MDPASYKDFVTPRGFKYHYFFSSADSSGSKPTLVFLHGFPSNAHEWRHQVGFFVQRGYGVLAPDLLGYGGTAKPTNVAAYAKSLMHEGIANTKVYAIGHDWGCALTSGLATFYPTRFAGFGFLSVGHLAPTPDYDFEAFNAGIKAIVGYQCFGYWYFFAEGADKIIANHIGAFLNILYPHDPKTWLTDMAPRDKLKNWVLSHKVTPPPSYLTQEDFDVHKAELLEGSLAGPLCWYKQYTTAMVAEDDKLVPKENYIIKQPVFFAATLNDYICRPEWGLLTLKPGCPNLTIKEYHTDHWVQLAVPEQLNKDLLEWIEGQ